MSETKKLYMTDLKKYCDSLVSPVFVYDNHNDLGNTAEGYRAPVFPKAIYAARYNKMIMMLAPNRLCFRNSESSITFEGVKEIKLTRDWIENTDIISIVCCGDDVMYRIIIEKRERK